MLVEVFADDRGKLFFHFWGHDLRVGEYGVLQGGRAFASTIGGHGFDGLAEDILRVGGVLIQGGDDGFDGYGVVFGMPAIVVGNHGDGGIADFGFAGEFGFGDVGHTDDGKLHGAVEVGFGESGELWTFHADVGSLFVDGNALRAAGFGEDGGKLRASRLVEGDVSDDAVAEESGFATFGAVEELIGDQELARLEIFPERAHGTDRDDALHAEEFHGVDVGAEVEFRRKDAVAAAVAGEERDALSFQSAEDEGVGGIAEGSFEAEFASVGQSGHGVEAAATDDTDVGKGFGLAGFCFGHVVDSGEIL
jgi:hypothetical protein